VRERERGRERKKTKTKPPLHKQGHLPSLIWPNKVRFFSLTSFSAHLFECREEYFLSEGKEVAGHTQEEEEAAVLSVSTRVGRPALAATPVRSRNRSWGGVTIIIVSIA
jgi:hypothetical protein